MSKKWYNRRSKRNRKNERYKIEAKKFKLKDIVQELSLCGFKQSSFEKVRAAVQLRLKHQDRLHDAFSQKQRLKLRFEARIAEQKSIDQIIKRLRGGSGRVRDKVKLVVFGDGSRMSGIRGTSASVPNRNLQKHAVCRGRNEGFLVKG